MKEKEIILPNSFISIYVDKDGVDEIIRCENWENIDLSQFEDVIDDLMNVTFNLTNNGDEDYMFDITDEFGIQYFKPMNFDFESRPCCQCSLNSFDYEKNEEFDDTTSKLIVDKNSILEFFELLKDKYDSRIVDLCRVFIHIVLVLPKEIADRLYNHEELPDLSGCEYEGCFYHCFRCEVLKDEYGCRDCEKWSDEECDKCLFKYIQENKK